MATPTIPELSLPGNLLVLAVNVVIARYAWKAGGWWKVLAVLNGASALIVVGRIAKQI